MLSRLNGIRTRLIVLITTGLLLAALAGLASALLFDLTSVAELLAPSTFTTLTGFAGLLAVLAGFHFSRSLGNGHAMGRAGPAASSPSTTRQRRLLRFSRDYWGLFLLYALGMPALLLLAADRPIAAMPGQFLQLLVLQLSVAALIGLPTYQLALEQVSTLAGPRSLHRLRISPKFRLVLLGGFLPLLSYSVLMTYHWQQTGNPGNAHMAFWLVLVCLTAVITLLSVRSQAQSLQPLQGGCLDSAAASCTDPACLPPRPRDETGPVTRTPDTRFRCPDERTSRMQAVVEALPEGIIVVDRHGLVNTFNPAAEKLFGYLAAEIRQQPVERLLPALLDAENRLRHCDADCELVGYHRNGTAMQLSVRVSITHHTGQQFYTCLVADITRRKATEARLRDAESRYRDLVETAHDMVWTMDSEGRLTYLNAACESIYGFEPAEMLFHRLEEFRAPDHPPHDLDAIQALLHGEDSAQFETVHLDDEGKPHFLSFSAKTHKDAAGQVVRISGTARDITEQKAFQHQLSYHAEHDPLTGLFNRHYFQEELERTVARVARSGLDCALFFIDLDQFKYINDTLGHAAGDRLLVDIAALLSAHVRDGDLLARFGGDEFTLLLYNINQHDVMRAAENFRALCDDYRFTAQDKSFSISCSVGIAMIDRLTTSAEEVLSHADLACNIAKQQGRNRTNLYNPADLDKAGMAADMGWATRVREMLEQDRFQLVYQPIMATADGAVLEYEVLVRMVCDDGQIILPGGFMPAAERFGLIHSVDRWIVRRAIQQLAHLHANGRRTGFSINLSGKAFEDATLLPMIRDLLADSGLDPTWVTFEITETAAIANLSAAEEFITSLKDIGCQFALDDFGCGFSSFAYLKHLPVDKLKIDGGFVKGMAHSSVDQAMVESMNQVAHALGKQTVAECVENSETLQLLREMGIDRAQGHHIGRPNPIPLSMTRHERRTARRNSAPAQLCEAPTHSLRQ